MVMKWYPWLNTTYRQILTSYQQQHGHHALLLHSHEGNGETSLFYALTRWLMCCQPVGIKSCGSCRSCQLMQISNHPDHYWLKPEKGKLSIGIEIIRNVIYDLHGHIRQGKAKVVWLLQSEALTEQATNALLKTLEEPPDNTYFLLGCQEPSRLLPTLLSRCLYWPLPSPKEELGLYWLQQQKCGYDQIAARTALRLSSGAPLAAFMLLQPTCWQERLVLCEGITQAIASNNFLQLLSLLHHDQDDAPLHWLISLLTDAIKWQHSLYDYLVNLDQPELIAIIAMRWTASSLHHQIHQWFAYRCQLHEISSVNRELILTHQLLNYEQDATDKQIYH